MRCLVLIPIPVILVLLRERFHEIRVQDDILHRATIREFIRLLEDLPVRDHLVSLIRDHQVIRSLEELDVEEHFSSIDPVTVIVRIGFRAPYANETISLTVLIGAGFSVRDRVTDDLCFRKRHIYYFHKEMIIYINDYKRNRLRGYRQPRWFPYDHMRRKELLTSPRHDVILNGDMTSPDKDRTMLTHDSTVIPLTRSLYDSYDLFQKELSDLDSGVFDLGDAALNLVIVTSRVIRNVQNDMDHYDDSHTVPRVLIPQNMIEEIDKVTEGIIAYSSDHSETPPKVTALDLIPIAKVIQSVIRVDSRNKITMDIGTIS